MNLYNIGVQYLKENIPCLNKTENWCKFIDFYFSKPDYSSLDNVFFEIPNSMYSQRRGKYIQYPNNEDAIMKILHGNSNKRICDFQYIHAQYGDNYQRLVDDLQKEIGFKINNKNPNLNSWVIFAKSICSAAAFLSQFHNYESLAACCSKESPTERLEVADEILKQRGAGCNQLVMTLNWLKDIGMPGYIKPDIHLCRIIIGVFKDEFLLKGHPYTSIKETEWAEKLPKIERVQRDVFIKGIIQSSEDGSDIFAFDRLIYQIGSGDFWGTDELFKRIKTEYAESVRGQNKDKRFIDYVINHK